MDHLDQILSHSTPLGIWEDRTYILKMAHSRALFYFIFVFSTQLTVNECLIKVCR